MKKIITNYKEDRYEYPLCNGEDKPNRYMVLRKFRESNKEFYERLVALGYTRISFYEVTTRVRGLHDLIAYVK